MNEYSIIFVPVILFVIFVAPLWLILHYRSKNQLSAGLTEREMMEIEKLAIAAEKMSQRIVTLEKLLDSESPNWREHDD